MGSSRRSRNLVGLIGLTLTCLWLPASSTILPGSGSDVIDRLPAPGNGSLVVRQLQNEPALIPESSNISDGSTESPHTQTTSGPIIEEEVSSQSQITESMEESVPVIQASPDEFRLQTLKHANESRIHNILLFGLAGEAKSTVLKYVFGQQFIQPEPESNAAITEYVLTNTFQPGSPVRIVDTPALTLAGHPQNASQDAQIFTTLLEYYSAPYNPSPNLIMIALPQAFEGEIRLALSNVLQRTAILKEVFTQDENGTDSPSYLVMIVQGDSDTNQNNSSKSVAGKICAESDLNSATHILNLERTVCFTLQPRLKENETRLQPCNCCNCSWAVDANGLQQRLNLPLPLVDGSFSSDNQTPDSSFVRRTHPLTNDSDLVERMVQVWSAGAALRSHPSNEVSAMLQASYAKLNSELRRRYPGSLSLLQAMMLTRNITTSDQVPNELRSLLFNATNMNPAMLALLQTTFPVVISEIHFDPLAGKGYDPITDSPTESPFVFDDKEICRLGFLLPKSIRMTPRNSNAEVNHIKFHTSAKSLVASRMKELNLTINLNETSFGGEFRPGDILLSLFKSPAATRARITAAREIHKFQFTLHREDVKFKPEFLDQIAAMPTFSVHDRGSVQEWNAFLDEYGTYVVTSAFGGGSLEAMLELKNQEFRLFRSGNVTAVRRVLEAVLSNPAQFVNSNPNMTILSLSAKGGDAKYQNLNLIKLNRTVLAGMLESWKNSLVFDPVMLQTKLKLVPLSEFVRGINSSAANELTSASKALFEGNLRYSPLPQPKPATSVLAPAPSPIQSVRHQTGSDRDRSDQPQKLKRAGDSVLPPRTSATTGVGAVGRSPPGPISALPRSMLATREQFEQNNKLLECLQAFIASLDVQIQQSPDDSTLAPLANDIEQLYNQIANTGTAGTRERLLIEVICLNFSKTQSLPIEQLKNLVQFPEDLKPETELPPAGTASAQSQSQAEDVNGFPQLHTAKLRSTDANLISRMKNIAGSVWQLDGLPKPQRQITDYRFIGYGYDLLWDQVTSHSPFLLTENSFTKINMRTFPRPEVVFQYFTTKSDYVVARWRSLVPISFRQFLPSRFRGRLQPGHSYEELDYVSVVLEYRKSLVRLPVDERHYLRLSEGFRSEVDRLPVPFDPSSNNCTSANAWKRFLNRYGTHTIIESFLGGAIEIRGIGRVKESLLQLRARGPQAHAGEIFSILNSSCVATTPDSNCTFRVIGGNSSILTSWNAFDSEEFESWVASIPSNLVILPSSIKLKNIYHVIMNSFGVGSASGSGAEAEARQFLIASNAYHSGELKACHGSTRCGPFQTYNETSDSCTCRAGQIWDPRAEESCEILVGHNCSTASWDNCVQDAVCTEAATSQNGSPICNCRQGDALPSGKCSVSSSDLQTTQSCQNCNPTTTTTVLNATMTCSSEAVCGIVSSHSHDSTNNTNTSQSLSHTD